MTQHVRFVCAVCGTRLAGVDLVGHWWVWVHDDGHVRGEDGHRAQPIRGRA